MVEAGEDCCVKVAVHVRPLIGEEKVQGCKDCVTVVSGKPQVRTRIIFTLNTQCDTMRINVNATRYLKPYVIIGNTASTCLLALCVFSFAFFSFFLSDW